MSGVSPRGRQGLSRDSGGRPRGPLRGGGVLFLSQIYPRGVRKSGRSRTQHWREKAGGSEPFLSAAAHLIRCVSATARYQPLPTRRKPPTRTGKRRPLRGGAAMALLLAPRCPGAHCAAAAAPAVSRLDTVRTLRSPSRRPRIRRRCTPPLCRCCAPWARRGTPPSPALPLSASL